MKLPVEYIIGKFLRTYKDPFTLEEFSEIMKEMNFKCTDEECIELLRSFDCVFELEGNRYITRAGAFTGYYFSFCPTQEEIEKGVFIAGHRCMPFVDNEVVPSSMNFFINGERIPKKVEEFNAGLLMDLFSLYGDEYSSQIIASDPANRNLKLSETDFNLPPVTKMTCYDIRALVNSGQFAYGDRFLCYVEDWNENKINAQIIRKNREKSVLDPLDLERENWYSVLEEKLLADFETIGPCDSMESQLAFTFINNYNQLSLPGCGSVEEMMMRTKKVGFEPYGVESRLWKKGADIPVVGKWNEEDFLEAVQHDRVIEMTENDIAPDYIVDVFVKNALFAGKVDFDEMVKKIYPNHRFYSKELQNQILLHLKNRHDILKKSYNYFADYVVGLVRVKVASLFSAVNELSVRIGVECNDLSKLPSQELVVLGQLHQQLMRFMECFQYDDFDAGESLTDMEISVDNMAMSFDVISEDLNRAVNSESKKGFKIVKSFDKGDV